MPHVPGLDARILTRRPGEHVSCMREQPAAVEHFSQGVGRISSGSCIEDILVDQLRSHRVKTRAPPQPVERRVTELTAHIAAIIGELIASLDGAAVGPEGVAREAADRSFSLRRPTFRSKLIPNDVVTQAIATRAKPILSTGLALKLPLHCGTQKLL